MKTVLFLCSGNYYRSRFAEIFFNWQARQRGLTWKAESRGLAIDPRNPGSLSHHTMDRLRVLGIPLEGYHRPPRAVGDHDFEAADHVIAVKGAEHRPLIERDFPARLTRVEFWEVHDLDCASPDEAIPELELAVIGLIGRLAAKHEARNPNDEGNPKP